MSSGISTRAVTRMGAAVMVTTLVASLTVGVPAAVAATGDSEPHTGNGCGSLVLNA